MVWFKVDDGFHSHPKVLTAGVAAAGLWVIAGTWSSANLTNGFVPGDALRRLDPDGERHAEKLVKVGLWIRVPDGYLFHDWQDYQPNSDAIKIERAFARERMRKLRSRRRGKDEGAGQEDRSPEHAPNDLRTSSERSEDVRNPVPVPEPVPEGSSGEEPSARAGRPRRVARRTDPDFERFYEIYPKHVGRLGAERAWKKATKQATPAEIIAGAERYAEARRGQDPEFTAGPAPWLNNGRWTDEPVRPRPNVSESEKRAHGLYEKALQLKAAQQDTTRQQPQLPAGRDHPSSTG